MTEALIDSLSPLTPQAIESDDSWINNDPYTFSRTETPITQVLPEGVTPSREQFEGNIPEDERIILLNPRMALATVTEFLNEVRQQWLKYRHGPEDFNNHGVNPRLHQAFAVDRMLEALLKEDNRNMSSRASSQETFLQIKVEEQTFQGVSKTPAREDDLFDIEQKSPVDTKGKGKGSGLAPSMLNRPAYLSGRNSDIICHLYGQRRGTVILHQMVQYHVTAEYNLTANPRDPEDPRDDNNPDGDDQNSQNGRHNPPRGGRPGGEGPPGGRRPGGEGPPRRGPPEDPDNDDPDENDENDEDNGVDIPTHPTTHPVVHGQGAYHNYLSGITPRNTCYRDHMQD
jgi:hypothetical protein